MALYQINLKFFIHILIKNDTVKQQRLIFINEKELYHNNLDEIMPNEANTNRNLTQKQLDDIILPEQARENPKYKNIKKTLFNRKTMIKTSFQKKFKIYLRKRIKT